MSDTIAACVSVIVLTISPSLPGMRIYFSLDSGGLRLFCLQKAGLSVLELMERVGLLGRLGFVGVCFLGGL